MPLIYHVTSRESMFKGLCEFMEEARKPVMVSYHFAMFGGHWSSASGDIEYLTYQVTLQIRVIKGSTNVMTGGSSIAYHHLAKFGDHRYCSSRNVMFLVCHVIRQDLIIKGSGDYKDRNPSR